MRLLCTATLALCACATGSTAGSETSDLRAEVKALREDNARLEHRITQLERQKTVAAAAAAMPTPVAGSPPASSRPEPKTTAEVPSLTVVKLKPRHEAAPKLKTEVDVLEPSADVLEAMKKIQAEDKGQPTEPAEIDAATGDDLFDKGLQALKTGNVSGGVEQLQSFAASAPNHAKADNALYFSGVGLMGLNSYEQAARAFEEVQARYPAGDAVQDSMLKLAECRMKLNKPAEARAVYMKIVSRFPGTAAADQAQGRLTQLR
jgi:tol-pal system protein YbgF